MPEYPPVFKQVNHSLHSPSVYPQAVAAAEHDNLMLTGHPASLSRIYECYAKCCGAVSCACKLLLAA